MDDMHSNMDLARNNDKLINRCNLRK